MKRLFNLIVTLITLFLWTSCENLVEEEGPIEYSKPSSVEVSASNSRESLDITLTARPNGQSVKSVASASFAYSFSENLADATTVSAIADGDAFTATFRSLDYGKRLYFQATIVSALGARMTSSVWNILVPAFSEFVKVSAPELVEATSSTITLKSDYQSVEGIAIAERGFCWSSELAVPNIENERVIAAEGFQCAIEGLGQMQTINARAYVKDASGNIAYSEVEQFTTDAVLIPEYVDLGLSVKWATCNLGATKPEEYGGYYQWAGIKDMTSTSFYLDWSNTPYHTGSNSNDGWTKYVPSGEASYWYGTGTPDNKTVLDLEDDVVHVALGDKWRLPTDYEWTELMNNCTWSFASENGIEGYRVTSEKPGYTDKSIFLPIAASRYNDTMTEAGSYGRYWSSSLYIGKPSSAYCVYFNSALVRGSGNNRSFGFSARPVYGDVVHVSSVSLNKSTLSINEGHSETLTVTVNPSNVAEKSVNWKSSNTSVATVDASGKVTAVKAGSSTITVTTVDGSKTANCSVTVISPSTGSAEYVDLGLSVKWATCNLGASKPEELGGYYQWAGTKDVTSTSIYLYWDNVPYHTGSDGDAGWTKYIPSNKGSYWSGSGNPDNKTVLDPDDDAAHVTLGGKWRMPTDDEWAELMNDCTLTWTTVNGVNGYRLTSKKSGYTNKSIFMPAAGHRRNSSLISVGTTCYYWSSSLFMDNPESARNVYFTPYTRTAEENSRSCGLSIRPVYGDAVQEVRVSSVSLNKTTLSLEEGQSETLTATVSPSNATNNTVTWKSSNSSVATVDSNGKVIAVKAGSATITVTTVDGSKTANCSVTVTSPSTGSAEYVDLGLSVKWATCNLGASKPEEYGLYYQWGDTHGYGSKTSDGKYFYWEDDDGKVTYKWCNGSYDTMTKYNTDSYFGPVVDNKTVLDPADDAAHVALGGKWRMPTDEEWTELRTNCIWTWTTVNGVRGYRVTSKKSGYTNKSIFLPAAGFRFLDSLKNVGTDGYYWPSSLNSDYPCNAFYINFTSDESDMGDNGRFNGYSIRPVSD